MRHHSTEEQCRILGGGKGPLSCLSCYWWMLNVMGGVGDTAGGALKVFPSEVSCVQQGYSVHQSTQVVCFPLCTHENQHASCQRISCARLNKARMSTYV